MKAFYIDTEGSYINSDQEKPNVGVEEVLLKIHKVGLCGSDLNTYRKLNPMVTYPRIPGHEVAASILEVGSSVPKEWKIGDEVCLVPYTNCNKCAACEAGRINCCEHNKTLGVQQNGAMSEEFSIHYSKLLKFPKLSLEELALVEPLSVGYHAVMRGKAQSQDLVVVIGCGMIGIGAIFGALLQGCQIIAIDIDDKKLELMKSYGVKYTINSLTQNVIEEINKISNNKGANLVIEAVGNAQTYTMAIDIASFAGRVVYIGYTKVPVSYETKYFVMKELDICGSRNAFKDDFIAVGEYLSDEKFDITPLITQKCSFDEVGYILDYWSKNPSQVIKILVQVS